MVKAKKTFGQNFLIDSSVVDKIISAADIQPGETVLEIGPGTGILTAALVKAGARVIAIEYDHDLIAPLKEKFGDTIELIEGDVMQFPLLYKEGMKGWSNNSIRDPSIPALVNGRITKFKLIANIPYNITSQILERFLAHKPRPMRMVLMLQKEVADRVLAKPPRMSLLSVVCQIYAKCTRVANVKAGSFRPIPKVDSAIVQFDLCYLPPCKGGSMMGVCPERVISLAKAGFSSPRKQLKNNLSHLDIHESDLQAVGLAPNIRAENLTVEDWTALLSTIR